MNDLDRFWSKVNKTSRCWVWTGAKVKTYGQFWNGKKNVMAHRFAYETVMPIPVGMTIDHICRNPPCVRPDHLEAVTLRENILRSTGPTAINAKKKFCHRGHSKWGPRKVGRYCRVCNMEKNKANDKTPKRKAKNLEHKRRWADAHKTYFKSRYEKVRELAISLGIPTNQLWTDRARLASEISKTKGAA